MTLICVTAGPAPLFGFRSCLRPSFPIFPHFIPSSVVSTETNFSNHGGTYVVHSLVGHCRSRLCRSLHSPQRRGFEAWKYPE